MVRCPACQKAHDRKKGKYCTVCGCYLPPLLEETVVSYPKLDYVYSLEEMLRVELLAEMSKAYPDHATATSLVKSLNSVLRYHQLLIEDSKQGSYDLPLSPLSDSRYYSGRGISGRIYRR